MKHPVLQLIAIIVLIVFVSEISIDYSSMANSNPHKDLAELVLDSEEEDGENKERTCPVVHHNLWFEIVQSRIAEHLNEVRVFTPPEKTVLSWNVPLYLEDCVFLI